MPRKRQNDSRILIAYSFCTFEDWTDSCGQRRGGVVVNTQLTMHILTCSPIIIKQEGRDEGFRGSVRNAASGF